MTMKASMKNSLLLISMMVLMNAATSCKKESKDEDITPPPTEEIKGTPGDPRFNLQFDNSADADLDIHVLTPNGSEISYSNPSGQGGTLDVDCLCGDCATGPNENVFWVPGNAPRGTYKVWVEYFGSCGDAIVPSNFTLRIMNTNTVLRTIQGTLAGEGDKSNVQTFEY
jgi:uncharacterized protein YfaP (DUF2135 family)